MFACFLDTVCNCLPLSVLSAYFCFTLATIRLVNKVDIIGLFENVTGETKQIYIYGA